MKLYIKQRVFSWDDSFNVRDSKLNIIYKCDGEDHLIGKDSYEIYQDKNKVAEIHQRIISLRPKFTIEIGNEEFEVVKRALNIRDSFHVKKLDWDITGDFINHEYVIKKDRKLIATIKKRLVTVKDSYELDIVEYPNTLAVVCCCIIIEAVMAEEKKEQMKKKEKKARR